MKQKTRRLLVMGVWLLAACMVCTLGIYVFSDGDPATPAPTNTPGVREAAATAIQHFPTATPAPTTEPTQVPPSPVPTATPDPLTDIDPQDVEYAQEVRVYMVQFQESFEEVAGYLEMAEGDPTMLTNAQWKRAVGEASGEAIAYALLVQTLQPGPLFSAMHADLETSMDYYILGLTTMAEGIDNLDVDTIEEASGYISQANYYMQITLDEMNDLGDLLGLELTR